MICISYHMIRLCLLLELSRCHGSCKSLECQHLGPNQGAHRPRWLSQLSSLQDRPICAYGLVNAVALTRGDLEQVLTVDIDKYIHSG